MAYTQAVIAIIAGLIVPGFLIVIIFILITFKKELKLNQLLKRCCCKETRLMVKKRQATENPYILDNRGFLGRHPAVLSDDVELATHADMAILRQSMRQSIHQAENRNNTRPAPTQANAEATPTETTNSSEENLVRNISEVPQPNGSTRQHRQENCLPVVLPSKINGISAEKISKSKEDINCDSVEIEYENIISHDTCINVPLPLRSRPNTIIDKCVDSSDDESDLEGNSDYILGQDIECSITDLVGDYIHRESIEGSVTENQDALSRDYGAESDIECSVTGDSDIHLDYIQEDGQFSVGEDHSGVRRVNQVMANSRRPNSFANYGYYDVQILPSSKRHTCIGIRTPDANLSDIDIYENCVVHRQKARSQVYENVTAIPKTDTMWDADVALYADHISMSVPHLEDNFDETDEVTSSLESDHQLLSNDADRISENFLNSC